MLGFASSAPTFYANSGQHTSQGIFEEAINTCGNMHVLAYTPCFLEFCLTIQLPWDNSKNSKPSFPRRRESRLCKADNRLLDPRLRGDDELYEPSYRGLNSYNFAAWVACSAARQSDAMTMRCSAWAWQPKLSKHRSRRQTH